MFARRAASLLLLLTLVTPLTVACEAITGPSELERKIAAEQQVIAAYSAEVPATDALQRAFIDEWTRANEHKDLKVYRDALNAEVLPALARYLDAAKAMPTGSEELSSIHAILVEAYEGAQAQFKTFAAGLTEDNLEAGYRELLARMDDVKRAEARYLQRLKLYYAKNRVDLVQEP